MGKAARVQRTRQQIEDDRFDLDDIEPVVITPDGPVSDDEPVDMIHLFTIGERQYYGRRRVPFSATVRAFNVAATRGDAAGVAFELIEVLGPDGYNALMEADGIKPEHFEAIVKAVHRIFSASGRGKSH